MIQNEMNYTLCLSPYPEKDKCSTLQSILFKHLVACLYPFLTILTKDSNSKIGLLKKGDAGIKEYWLVKNQISLDGKPTLINDKNA